MNKPFTLQEFEDAVTQFSTMIQVAKHLGWRRQNLKRELDERGIDFNEAKERLRPQDKNQPKDNRRDIDWNFIESCFEAQMSIDSVVREMGLSKNYLGVRCKQDLSCTLTELKNSCQEYGEDNLKRKMYELALDGNPKLLMHLSRYWLKYNDKVNVETDEEQQVTVKFNLKTKEDEKR